MRKNKIKIRVKDIELDIEFSRIDVDGPALKSWVSYLWKLQTKEDLK